MRPWLASLLAAAALTASFSARAQDATATARVLFNAGAQAYEAGQFNDAIQAFSEAYRLAPRPGILFSAAQAHRKQFFVDHQPAHAREAIKLYRDYINMVQQGGRRGDAVQALSELEPMVERLGADAAPLVERKPSTRISISAQAKDAVITVDGKPIEPGIFRDIAPGKHQIHVTAPGYFPDDREVPVAEGGLSAFDIPMREQPGELTVSTVDGADVAIDGRSAATTPLARPIELTPGTHFVAVTKRGTQPYSEELEIGRGETKNLNLHLAITNQRIAAYSLLGIAGASIVTGVVLGAVGLSYQASAQSIANQLPPPYGSGVGGVPAAQLNNYNNDLSTRNDLRLAGGVALGAGVAVGVTGLLLAVFDVPNVAAARRAHEGDENTKPTGPSPRERPVDLAMTPILGPGFRGGALALHF